MCQLNVQSAISIGKISKQTKQNLILDKTTKIKVIFRVFQSSEDKRKAREDRQTRATRGKITPVMQAKR